MVFLNQNRGKKGMSQFIVCPYVSVLIQQMHKSILNNGNIEPSISNVIHRFQNDIIIRSKMVVTKLNIINYVLKIRKIISLHPYLFVIFKSTQSNIGDNNSLFKLYLKNTIVCKKFTGDLVKKNLKPLQASSNSPILLNKVYFSSLLRQIYFTITIIWSC